MSTASQSLGFIAGVNLDPTRFTPEEIAAAELLIQQFMTDFQPDLNVSKISTLYDLNVRSQAIIYLLNKAQSQALQSTQSLHGVVANPSLANDSVVDAILSNVGVVRRPGAAATGRVRLFLSTGDSLQIPATTTFMTASGLIFRVSQSYLALQKPAAAGDLQIFQAASAGSSWYVLVPVVAAAPGINYLVPDQTPLICQPAPSNLVVCRAFGDFQGGLDPETTASLVNRIAESMAARNLTSPTTIASTLKQNFPALLDIGIQGMSGEAMTRNSDNLLSFKSGGFVDLYCRTSQGLTFASVDKVASLIDQAGSIATYMVQMDRQDLPGHYFIEFSVAAGQPQTSSYTLLSESRNFENRVDPAGGITGTARPNKIRTPQEAVYSVYQTNQAVFQVEGSPDETFAFPSAMNVTVQAALLPGLQAIQSYVNDLAVGCALADYLVRAPVPCLVRFSEIVIEGAPGTSIDAIRSAIYFYCNSIPMGGRLQVDEVIGAIKGVAGVRFVRLPLVIQGQILAPSGGTISLRGSSFLEVPSRPLDQVVPENTCFFLQPSDIPITLVEI